MTQTEREKQVAIAYDEYLNGPAEPEENAANICGFIQSDAYKSIPPVTVQPEPSKTAEDWTPQQLCPRCSGQKTQSKPPWVAGDQRTWSSGGTELYPCVPCNGTGLIPMLPPKKG